MASTRCRNRKQEQLLRDNFLSPRRVREWRDVHSQLQTVVASRLAPERRAGDLRADRTCRCWPACSATSASRATRTTAYLGARGIRFYTPSGRAPVEEAGALDHGGRAGRDHAAVRARHRARSSRSGCERVGAPRAQEAAARAALGEEGGQVVALERATLYGIVIYSKRRINFGDVDPAAAREIFIREALVAGEWETRAAVLRAQPQADRADRGARAQVAPPGRAGRRRTDLRVLRPAAAGRRVQRRTRSSAGTARRSSASRELLLLTREELMRHEAAGITTAAFPKTMRSAASNARRPTCTSRATRATA